MSGLSQPRFAAALGISVRNVQDWEQGLKRPTGAARALLRIVSRYPHVVGIRRPPPA